MMIQQDGRTAHVVVGPVLQSLRMMPDKMAQMCVTSPPYFGLRDYGVEGQIGLEETPEQFIAALVEVFREVRRVLKDDGTLWVNIGDSYAGKGGHGAQGGVQFSDRIRGQKLITQAARYTGGDCKEKDLIGIPWMLAFALRGDGWYWRSEIVWHKPNPMPESVTDRPTKAHEIILLFSKRPKYFYDAEAITEPCSPNTHARMAKNIAAQAGSLRANGGAKTNGAMKTVQRKSSANAFGVKSNEQWAAAHAGQPERRNKRSVWTVAPRGYAGAHFAVYPPELIEPCILAGSKPGDIVLEPFSGSGTTAGVSLKHGRNCVAFELNPEYAALTGERVASICR